MNRNAVKIAAAACLGFGGALMWDTCAQAVEPDMVFLQDFTFVGTGDTLTVSRLQFTNGSGAVECDDVAIPFVSSAGDLTVGTPKVTTCGKLKTRGFVAGTYVLPSSPKDNTIAVAGPAAGRGGSTVWSLALTGTDDPGTKMLSARWTAGPISDNPEAAAYLKSCNITPDPNTSYGFGNTFFSSNTLVALVQTGDNLTVQAYNGCNVYFTVTYTKSAMSDTSASDTSARAPDTVFVQDFTIVGAGDTLTVSRLPFTNGSGTVECDDITIPFIVSSAGVLTVGTPDVTSCVKLKTNHFVAGTYALPSSPKDNTISVAGPAAGRGGSTVWSLALTGTDDSGTKMLSARWTAGPISDNPEAAAYLVKSCTITPDPNTSYGFGNTSFASNTLVAMVQTGDNLTVQAYNGCNVYFTVTYAKSAI